MSIGFFILTDRKNTWCYIRNKIPKHIYLVVSRLLGKLIKQHWKEHLENVKKTVNWSIYSITIYCSLAFNLQVILNFTLRWK